MSFSLLPKGMVSSLTDLSQELLQKKNIQLLMLDFDNTIVPYTTNVPTAEMEHWLKSMAASPIKLCVVSNSKRSRVKEFCKEYGIDCITRAKKPFSRGIRKCMNGYGVSAQACALVGDQIFTDTLGANCAGVTSILVKAIHNHNIWLKLRHVAEMPFILLARGRKWG